MGFVVSMLLSSRSGAEVRSDLRGRAATWRTIAGERAADLRERGASQVRGARDSAAQKLNTVRQRGSEMFCSLHGISFRKAEEPNDVTDVEQDAGASVPDRDATGSVAQR